MLALALDGVATPMTGASGGPAGVTDTALDAGLVPRLLVAVTVQLYSVPLVRPVTVIGLAVPFTACVEAAEHAAVYPVMSLPPLLAGAVNATTADALAAVTDVRVGASGAPFASEVGPAEQAPAAKSIAAVNAGRIIARSPRRYQGVSLNGCCDRRL